MSIAEGRAGLQADRRFPSPLEVGLPRECEGWEELYPPHTLFAEDRRRFEESRFWFQDAVHYAEPYYPFDAMLAEYVSANFSQASARRLVVPTSLGVEHRILGGYVYPKTGVALGPLTVRMMEDIHVHQLVMSVGGVSAKGLFNSNLLLVETERRMLRCADEVVVVADHTKIGRQALAFLCELSAIDTLIVDIGISTEQRRLVEDAGVRLLTAGAVAANGEEFQR